MRRVRRERDKSARFEPYYPRTRNRTAPERNAAIEAEIARLQAEAEALRQRREEAIRNQPVAPPGNRGDGSFHIAFIKMGQGDCTILSTPAGRTVMIDCGSDATEQPFDEAGYKRRIHDTIYGPKFLQNYNMIDVLLLTHPDSDHYNKLKEVLPADVTIHNIYHSSDLVNYSVGNQSAWLRTQITNEQFIKAATLNETGNTTLNGNVVAPGANGTDKLDASGAIRILEEPNCTISILASNVTIDSAGDDSNLTNRGSVVTLIEAFGKKIMICGDATRSTEQFLVDQHGARIAELDVMQIPHHGSSTTSSAEAFVNHVRPKIAIASAGKHVFKDHLPRLETITKYLNRQADSVPNHELFYWEPGGLGSLNWAHNFTKRYLYTTGSNGTHTLHLSA